jgi:adenylosuccinate lyase
MAANLEALGGVVHSGEVLLALTRAGILREDAYRLVQRHAMETWEERGRPGAPGFRERLLADPEIAGRVPVEAIDRAMDPTLHLRETDRILARVFGEEGDGERSDGAADG